LAKVHGPRNRCRACNEKWYPLQQRESRLCPSCGSKDVYVERPGLLSLVAIVGVLAVMYYVGGSRSSAPEPRPRRHPVAVAPEPAPVATTQAPAPAVAPKPTPEEAIVLARAKFPAAREAYQSTLGSDASARTVRAERLLAEVSDLLALAAPSDEVTVLAGQVADMREACARKLR
jgi:hypothetical protein